MSIPEDDIFGVGDEASLEALSEMQPSEIAAESIKLKRARRAKAKTMSETAWLHGLLKILRGDIIGKYGEANLKKACKLEDEQAALMDMQSMEIVQWAIIVMGGSEFIPEESEMTDPDFYDSTLGSIFKHNIITSKMIQSFTEHLEAHMENMKYEGSFDEITVHAYSAENEGITDTADSSILPGWGSWS